MLSTIERSSPKPASDGGWLLLAELNHRIGNEFQAAISALRVVRRGLGAPADALRLIDDAVLRLESFGQVQQILDRHRGHPPLPQRLEALCGAISLARASPLGIHLVLQLDEVAADEETAWTVCVVASELITNAVKHAFPHGAAGVIGVKLEADEPGLVLTVADNGVGAARWPAQAAWCAPGLGSGLVSQLAERAGGAVTRIVGLAGTAVTFRAPATRRRP